METLVSKNKFSIYAQCFWGDELEYICQLNMGKETGENVSCDN